MVSCACSADEKHHSNKFRESTPFSNFRKIKFLKICTPLVYSALLYTHFIRFAQTTPQDHLLQRSSCRCIAGGEPSVVLTDVATPTAFTTNMCCVNQAVNCFLFLFIISRCVCLFQLSCLLIGCVCTVVCCLWLSCNNFHVFCLQCIRTVAEVIRGNPSNQQVFDQLQTPSTPPRPAPLAILMSMVSDKQPFQLRLAALYCFQVCHRWTSDDSTYVHDSVMLYWFVNFGCQWLGRSARVQQILDRTTFSFELLCPFCKTAVQWWNISIKTGNGAEHVICILSHTYYVCVRLAICPYWLQTWLPNSIPIDVSNLEQITAGRSPMDRNPLWSEDR